MSSTENNSPQYFMKEALEQAKLAMQRDEVPVGAVIVKENQVIASAHNEVETAQQVSRHAEIIAIERASRELGTWRLDGCSLFVTLEPCTMCIGAILHSRISKLYFACPDPAQGAVGSVYDISAHPGLPRQVEVSSGIYEKEARELLQQFFGEKRG